MSLRWFIAPMSRMRRLYPQDCNDVSVAGVHLLREQARASVMLTHKLSPHTSFNHVMLQQEVSSCTPLTLDFQYTTL